jgi:hypothetical protein
VSAAGRRGWSGLASSLAWGGVEVGSVSDGSGATTVSCFELFTITSAMTRPMTVSTAIAATIHSQRGDFGPSGAAAAGVHPAVLRAVLAGRVRVIAIRRVGGQPLGGRRRSRCLVGGAVGRLARICRIAVSGIAVAEGFGPVAAW